jgi:hypothetical protein
VARLPAWNGGIHRRDVDAAVSYGHADFEFEPPREFVEVGFEQIAACVDRLERAVSIARWSESPDTRRWRVGLRLIPTGTRHGGTPVGQVLELLSSLPGVLAEVQTPDEEQEQPRVYFGWSGLGKKTQPPSSVRSS